MFLRIVFLVSIILFINRQNKIVRDLSVLKCPLIKKYLYNTKQYLLVDLLYLTASAEYGYNVLKIV